MVSVEADLVRPITDAPVPVIIRPGALRTVARGISSAWEWIFGVITLIVALAVLATVPLIQFLSLGYLLEVCGRVARGGRLRDGFVGVRKAARAGTLVLGTAIMVAPLILTKYLGYMAYLIEPDSKSVAGWRAASVILLVVLGLHILSAWYRGGRLRDFLWPLWFPLTLVVALIRRRPLRTWLPPVAFLADFFRGRWYKTSRDAFWNYLVSLRLRYYFWLGFRGFFGAVVWLFLPVAMLVHAIEQPQGAGVLLGLIGAALFLVVLLFLPFLQAHFAAERRFRAMFEVRHVRKLFCRAPIAFVMALVLTLLLASPLYLLKIEATPREVAALPAVVFVAFTFPARLATGWAVGYARRRPRDRHFLVRWLARLAMLPVAAIYVMLVFFTQYSSWYGTWSLLEQHAFLLPVPFLNLP